MGQKNAVSETSRSARTGNGRLKQNARTAAKETAASERISMIQKSAMISLEWIIKIVLFAITFAIALRLCTYYYAVLDQSEQREAEQSFSNAYQAIMHLDPEFGELEDDVRIKTNDQEIRGFSDDNCKEGSCICLCDEGCTGCRDIPYIIKDDFVMASKDNYRIYTLVIEDRGSGYVLGLKDG